MPLIDDVAAALSTVPELTKALEAAKPLVAEIEAAMPASAARTEFDAAFTAAMNLLASLVHPSEVMVETLEGRASKALSRLGRFAKKVTSDVAGDVKDLVDDPAATTTTTVTPAATSTTEPVHVAAGKTS